MKIFKTIFLSTAALLSLAGCKGQDKTGRTVAVFVPGIIADSPTYQKLTEGAVEGVNQYNSEHPDTPAVQIKIMEAGTNQAQWKSQLTALASCGKYEVILSSNPSLPDIADEITQQFPQQKFIILDGDKTGNPNIATVSYRQNEQAYMAGYISCLMSKTKKIGLIAAQEYPIMNNVFLPEYTRGARDADRQCTVDFRIVGNWYDASKGKELADAMALSKVDAILPICGGASQGVISSAVEHGTYLTWFDSNGYSKALGHVILCSETLQSQTACTQVKNFLEGKTSWGTSAEVGLKDGFIKFHTDDPEYLQNVPEDIRIKVQDKLKAL